jgi:hypothetical protein
VLRGQASALATAATQLGKQVSSSYEAKVEQSTEGVRVVANTRPLNAAGWIEFGTADLPASAPLRRGAEAARLRVKGRR